MTQINLTSPDDERRHQPLNSQSLWAELNAAQKIAASSLSKYGFDISFIRLNQSENIVGMLLNGKPATINDDGEIDTDPDICIRNELI